MGRINANRVQRVLSNLIDEHGPTVRIRSDNGSELIGGHLHTLLEDNEMDAFNIDAGSLAELIQRELQRAATGGTLGP